MAFSLPSLSIRARLLSLAVLLLAVLALSSALLIGELVRDSQTLGEEAQLVSVVRDANLASKHFGDLKYWVADFAVSQLGSSQEKAAAARVLLGSDLKKIAPVDPAGVAAISREIEALGAMARRAGAAYSADDSASGNALMAQAKSHILTVDAELGHIVDRLERQALTLRDTSTRQSRRAVRIAIVGGIIVLVAALFMTALSVRSIVVPLRRLQRSMAAITRGDFDAPIPMADPPEIQAMATTLGMLRDSLMARDRLERERLRTQAEMRMARDAAEEALAELKTAQKSLIHAEKMASLGQLTAGIAHEIKNPLNFVNNFASLSNELLDELKDATAPAVAKLDADARGDIGEIITTLSGNLDKIAEHGRRADGIVKSMLAHSRGTSGERQQVDLNGLVEEALNLAYHGARAQDQEFNIALERDFAADIAPIELVPQDVTRVFLNLIGNGFHAVHQRRKADPAFRPVLRIATSDLGKRVEIRVRDNGTGIPKEHRDKLFQPFFTTKPAGEGTGLGLSISYDIVTQQHGGTISVESEEGSFTEFVVRLPRRVSAARPNVERAAGRAA
ncbi:MAG TPA: ATP-binding protein [Stellaceae bacterium]|nr:ATP-binding protein [Stellaceae bacterium]